MQVQTVDLHRQTVRVGIRRGCEASPPLLICNCIDADFEVIEPFAAALGVVVIDISGVGGPTAPVAPYRFSTFSALAVRLLS